MVRQRDNHGLARILALNQRRLKACLQSLRGMVLMSMKRHRDCLYAESLQACGTLQKPHIRVDRCVVEDRPF